MIKDADLVDKLIDRGREKEVYSMFKCRNSTHNPYEGNCVNCPALRTEEIEAENPTSSSPEGYVPLTSVVGDEAYYCIIADYISARKQLKKILKKVSITA